MKRLNAVLISLVVAASAAFGVWENGGNSSLAAIDSNTAGVSTNAADIAVLNTGKVEQVDYDTGTNGLQLAIGSNATDIGVVETGKVDVADIGSTVQAYSSNLDDWSNLATSAVPSQAEVDAKQAASANLDDWALIGTNVYYSKALVDSLITSVSNNVLAMVTNGGVAFAYIDFVGSAGTNMQLRHEWVAPTNYAGYQMDGAATTNLYPVDL